jgi:hypothetical protein
MVDCACRIRMKSRKAKANLMYISLWIESRDLTGKDATHYLQQGENGKGGGGRGMRSVLL